MWLRGTVVLEKSVWHTGSQIGKSHMTGWPKSIPSDLRNRIEEVMGFRTRPSGQDVWGAVHDWREANGVEPPPHLQDDG